MWVKSIADNLNKISTFILTFFLNLRQSNMIRILYLFPLNLHLNMKKKGRSRDEIYTDRILSFFSNLSLDLQGLYLLIIHFVSIVVNSL